ncbi:MAG: four helix bundle protein [Paludibacteraceae bacterium]|nr:four helix bundle protein [Paludibacteraceae bacterium]
MMDQNFRSLRAYQESKELVKQVYELLKKFPKEEQYALCDQLRRSVISVPSNIAEGMGRYSTKEQVRFLEIAFGSLMEVSAQMDVACDLAYVTNEDLKSIDARVEAVAALLSGLRNKRISQDVNL